MNRCDDSRSILSRKVPPSLLEWDFSAKDASLRSRHISYLHKKRRFENFLGLQVPPQTIVAGRVSGRAKSQLTKSWATSSKTSAYENDDEPRLAPYADVRVQ